MTIPQSNETVTSAVSLGRGCLVLGSSNEEGEHKHEVHVFPHGVVCGFGPESLQQFAEPNKEISTSEHSASTAPPSDSEEDCCSDAELDGEWCPSSVDKTVWLWELSAKERAELEQLGRRLRDIEYHKNKPADVVRFLRARPGDVESAETMFRNMVAWRIANKVDSILETNQPPKELREYYPGAILQGLDKDGDPVFLCRDGATDGAGMLDRFGHDALIRHAIWMREMIGKGSWIQEYEANQGRPVKRMTIVNDISGLNLFQYVANRPLLSTYGHILRLDQDYYPESAKKLIILRVPSLFNAIWKIIGGFLDEGVVEKMVFAGNREYQKVLSKYLDLEILPDCVVPGIGKGRAIKGMPSNFNGGPLPLK